MRTTNTLRIGAALAVTALALTACGSSDSGSGTGGSATAAGGFQVPDLKPLAALGTPEGKVSVLAWPGYVEDGSNDPAVDWVSDFEKESGCQVTVKTFGTSNLLAGPAARAVLGRDGSFGIRPEKIRLEVPGAPAQDGAVRAPGTIAEVVYAGPVTRYVVDLDAGGRLVVLEQNGHRTAPDSAVRGAPVELFWAERHVIEIPSHN